MGLTSAFIRHVREHNAKSTPPPVYIATSGEIHSQSRTQKDRPKRPTPSRNSSKRSIGSSGKRKGKPSPRLIERRRSEKALAEARQNENDTHNIDSHVGRRPLFSRPISWLRQLSDRSKNRSSTEDNVRQSAEQNNSWRNVQSQRSEGGSATMMPKESRQLYSTNHMQNSESAKHCSGYTEKSIYKADIEKNDMIDNTNSTDSKALEEIDLR